MSTISHKMANDSLKKIYSPRKSSYQSPKKTIQDEVEDLKLSLLESLKRDTSIAKNNHMIDIVKNLDSDGIERLYFHISNMHYNENHPQQQDCYGSINTEGLVELYKSKEPHFFDPNINDEAFSNYSDEDKKRIEEIKEIIAVREQEMEKEEEEWNKANFGKKLAKKIKGDKPTQLEDLKNSLSKLPKKFINIIEEQDFKKSLQVDISNNSIANTDSTSTIQKTEDYTR